jgi:hypothetical protein
MRYYKGRMDTNEPPSNIPAGTPEEKRPKEYVRTFAGDMKTAQGGGIPNLAPLNNPRSGLSGDRPAKQDGLAAEEPPHVAPLERIVGASPLPPVPARTEIPTPPEPPPVVKPVLPPEPPGPTPLETYSGDFSDRMKETHASAVTVLAAEQDRTQRVTQTEPQESSHKGLPYIIAGGVLLIIAGSAGAYFAYTHYLSALAPVVLAPSVSAPIFVDDREQVSGTGAVLAQAIEKSVNSPLASDTVRLLSLAGATSTVFSALDVSAPFVILRNINTSGSMAGVVNVGGVQSPFFILSVSSYSGTFSGMLSWEPFMRRDLETLFPPYPVTVATSSTATSTTSVPTSIPTSVSSPTTFADGVVANHDVRIYRDAVGRSILIYGYWNQTTLVIARDPAAFTEIVQRLATSRTQ